MHPGFTRSELQYVEIQFLLLMNECADLPQNTLWQNILCLPQNTLWQTQNKVIVHIMVHLIIINYLFINM